MYHEDVLYIYLFIFVFGQLFLFLGNCFVIGQLVIKLQKHTCKVAGKEAVYTASRGGLHGEQGRQAGAARFHFWVNIGELLRH